MASAIDQLKSGLTIGHAQLGLHGAQPGIIDQQPYFIWPNVDPFRKQGSLVDSVLPPGTANHEAEKPGGALQVARQFVRDARAQHLGVFGPDDPLRLLPFELRFLARRSPPDRWVIDLGRNDDTLINPQAYFQVADPEDRLFVPAEYVPLFVEKGWRRAS